MGGPLPDLPSDIYYLICGHLPATDLLAFSRCCRRSRAAAFGVTRVVAVASFDGAAVEVHLNPRSPAGWSVGGGIDLSELCYAPATDRRAVAAPRGPADAVSLTRWLRAARPRRLLLQRQPVGGNAPAAVPLAPFFDTLAVGLRGLASLDGVAVDGAAARAFAPAVRFPASLHSLCLSELDAAHPAAAVPAAAAALQLRDAGGGSPLHSLRLWVASHAWDDSAICPVVTSYLTFPLPALRSLALCCRADRSVTAAIARLDALHTLRLVCYMGERALAELALPRLPRLHVLDMGYGISQDTAAEAAAVRGRSLGSLALTTDWVARGAKNEVVLATRHLPGALTLRGQASHDVRQLCEHRGRGSLHSLAFSLGPDAHAMLGAAANGLAELRELTLYVSADANVGGLHAWPPRLRVARLVLRVATEDGATVNGLVSLLAAVAPAAATPLHTLVVECMARLEGPTLGAVGRRLPHLRRLHLKLCAGAAAAPVSAARRRAVEREAFAAIPGRVSVEWANDESIDP